MPDVVADEASEPKFLRRAPGAYVEEEEQEQEPPPEEAPPPLPPPPPERIILRRRQRRQRHRTHAWKVAFADFATAMMALFMVLWLMSAEPETRDAVSEYFNPEAPSTQQPPNNAPTPTPDDASPPDEQAAPDPAPSASDLARRIQDAMFDSPELIGLEDQVEVVVNAEGLRIELLESEEGTFFESGRPQPTGVGSQVIAAVGEQLATFGGRVVIEGHTDAKPYAAGADYTNWELSTDRANQARRLLMSADIPANRIAEVRGFASTRLRTPDTPEDASNRRVSIVAQFGP